jgi:flagellar biosynthetic protein FlhB
MADSSQRTEKPTKRRLEKARREGQFPSSRQFLAALQFLAFTALFSAGAGRLLQRLRETARYLLLAAFRDEPSPGSLTNLYRGALGEVFEPLFAIGAGLAGIALAVQLGSTRLGLAPQKLAPDLKRLSPLEKLRNLPSQNMAAVFESLLFLPLLIFAVTAAASRNLSAFTGMVHQGPLPALATVSHSIEGFLWQAGALFGVIGLLDFLRIEHRHTKSLRMSKQEVRDELKETEGDPHIKQRVRRIQRDLARRNMMREVPQATAVIVNPTHYSVAIRYEMETMAAPRVIAKGKNCLALRIRQIAADHEMPIVENQPLAQALYKSADVGQEIPAHLYRAVAEVLAYIFRVMNRGKK